MPRRVRFRNSGSGRGRGRGARGGRARRGSRGDSQANDPEPPTQLPTAPASPAPEAAAQQDNSAQDMAPNPQQVLDSNIRNTVQTLFSIQSNTHGYLGNETQRALVQNFQDLSSNLQGVASSAQRVDKLLPPELLAYIDEGRNPDIYTREFVELVQKGNKYLKGKSQALADFRDELAKQMVDEWPEMNDAVQRVLDGKGAGLEGLQGMAGGGNDTKATISDASGAS